MPTTVVKTIGSAGGRDYSTLQAWEDAAPANLVTADQIWRGECYNDSEFTVGQNALLTIAGSTTDATRYKELTAAAGQSFQDAAGVRTNALTYNQANGVGISKTGNYIGAIYVDENNVHLSRLQIKNTATSGATIREHYENNVDLSAVYKDLIVQGVGGTDGNYCSMAIQGNDTLINVCVLVTDNGTYGIFAYATVSGNTFIGCSVIRTTNQAASGTGINVQYGTTSVLKSCAIFGFTTVVTAGKWDTTASKNNATDAASGLPGSSNNHSVTFTGTTPFTQASMTGNDLRPVSGTTLAVNGFLDATNAPNDISAQARTATPTIGVWELGFVAPRTLIAGKRRRGAWSVSSPGTFF